MFLIRISINRKNQQVHNESRHLSEQYFLKEPKNFINDKNILPIVQLLIRLYVIRRGIKYFYNQTMEYSSAGFDS